MSAEKSIQRPKLKDLLLMYGDRVSSGNKKSLDKEHLNINDNLLAQVLVPTNIASINKPIDPDQNSVIQNDVLHVKLLKDEPQPISMVITQTSRIRDQKKAYSAFIIKIYEGNLEGLDNAGFISILGERKKSLGTMILQPTSDGQFDIHHRHVSKPYRGTQNESGENLSDIMLAACGQIVQSFANKNVQPQFCAMDTGQLSVMMWADKNGYTPMDNDQKIFERICQADAGLCIGQGLHVYEYQDGDTWDDIRARGDVRIIFDKTFYPNIATDSTDEGVAIITNTRGQIN